MNITQKPTTPKIPITENLHGHSVTDEYRWLENSDDPAVEEWVSAQNSYADNILSKAPVKQYAARLKPYFKSSQFSAPYKYGDYYFWEERKPNEDDKVLYASQGLDGEPIAVVDTNQQNEGRDVTLNYYFPSPSGKYVAFGIYFDGDEMSTLHIKETATGNDLKDTILYARFSSLAWLVDESGFYYTRCQDPSTVPIGEESLHQKVYFHAIGTPPHTDKLIFGEGRPKDDMIMIELSHDGTQLFLWVSQSWNRNDIFVYDALSQEISPVIEGLDAKFNFCLSNDLLIVHTDYNAPLGKVLAADRTQLPKRIDDWRCIVTEKEFPIDFMSTTNDRVLIAYMHNVASRLFSYNHKGRDKQELPVDPFSSVMEVHANPSEKEYFYSFESFVKPKVIYRHGAQSDEPTIFRASKLPDRSHDLGVEQVWFDSTDKTRIPMFIIKRKDAQLTGQIPTVLYGYGCHGTPYTPTYLKNALPWLMAGGIYAIVNIRGGGEFGEKWHRDGSLDKKQNTFEDFIAAAKYLQQHAYTNAAHLGAIGRSNGGLMIGAVITQRPELFRAAVCGVPVLDLYRFHKFFIAGRWIHEFGDPEKPEQFEWIRKWSPYHQVKNDTQYPAVYLETSENDTRVHPLHARKMAAALQATQTRQPVLLRTHKTGGHMRSGIPVDTYIDQMAENFAFLAWQLNLEIV